MPLDITFTLSDDDLARFQAIVDKARTAVEDNTAAEQIEQAARDLLRETRETELPEFIATRMSRLSIVIDMINDEEWNLSEVERRHVLSALAYLCDPEDLIPDHIPGLSRKHGGRPAARTSKSAATNGWPKSVLRCTPRCESAGLPRAAAGVCAFGKRGRTV
jgi:hypothetical protein